MYIEATRYSAQVYISQDYKSIENKKSVYINEPRYTAAPFLTFINILCSKNVVISICIYLFRLISNFTSIIFRSYFITTSANEIFNVLYIVRTKYIDKIPSLEVFKYRGESATIRVRSSRHFFCFDDLTTKKKRDEREIVVVNKVFDA